MTTFIGAIGYAFDETPNALDSFVGGAPKSNTPRPEQYVHNFVDDIFKYIFYEGFFYIHMLLKFILKIIFTYIHMLLKFILKIIFINESGSYLGNDLLPGERQINT